MKKLSPNATDAELMALFREAAINYEPPYSQREKEELWDRIRSLDVAPDRPGTGKKLVAWLALMLLLTFLGMSIRMGDSMLRLHKGHLLRTTGWRSHGDKGRTEAVTIPSLIEVKRGQPWPAIQRGNLSRPSDWRGGPAAGRSEVPAAMRSEVPAAMQSEVPAAVQREVQAAVRSEAQAAVKASTASAPGVRAVQKGWSIGIALGTDWSKVKNGAIGRTGLASGAVAQYRFARRWSAEMGLFVTSKLYMAPPQDYHAPAAYPGLLSVSAQCRVFELPINLRYDLLQKGRSMVFASAGLSSFWMQKENYDYNSEVNGTWYFSKTTIYNKNRYFLSIANFAFGYEYTWNKFTIQASPYVQLPLTGIGYGKVDLNSAGMVLSLKRRL